MSPSSPTSVTAPKPIEPPAVCQQPSPYTDDDSSFNSWLAPAARVLHTLFDGMSVTSSLLDAATLRHGSISSDTYTLTDGRTAVDEDTHSQGTVIVEV
jgi:hypothetical protein